MDEEFQEGRNYIEVRSYFVRERNALLVRAEFSLMYEDYYLHLLQHALKNEQDHDQMVKDILAAMTLHLCSRPWHETTAWTINFQNPLVNIFATGKSLSKQVVARALIEEVKEHPRSLFYSQILDRGTEPRQSMIEFEGANVFRAVEKFYVESEQRLARYFHHSEEDIVMVTAQPDCDIDWLKLLDDDAIRQIDKNATLSLLETRKYAFYCGCSIDKLLPILSSMSDSTIADMFGESESANITCPRCNALFKVTKDEVQNQS